MVPSPSKQPTARPARRGDSHTGALLVALVVAASVAAFAGCRQPREMDLVPGPDTEGVGAGNDAAGSDGAPLDGSGGQGTGGTATGTGSGGAPTGSGGAADRAGVDAGPGTGGSGGARAGSGGGGGNAWAGTGGAVAGGSGGTGGVIAGSTGGINGPVQGSGGATGGGTDAGADGPPACTGATHLCGGSCASNTSVNSCGSSCSSCPVPTGGAATCDGSRCGVSCPGGKSCNGKCIVASGCCADGDCPAQGDGGAGAAGKCNAATNACQYPVCGNSLLEMGEQCDPPVSGSCSATCSLITAATRTTLYTFDAGISPWTLYMTSPERLAGNSRLSHDAHNGEGSSGALKVEAPFDAPNQKVELQDTQAMSLDMRGRTIHARVRLASGLSDDTAHPGAIKLFAKSGASYDYASGVWTNLVGSGWAEVTLVADRPDFVQGTFSPGEVRQIGFELRVFSETQRPAPAVVYLDSIWY